MTKLTTGVLGVGSSGGFHFRVFARHISVERLFPTLLLHCLWDASCVEVLLVVSKDYVFGGVKI